MSRAIYAVGDTVKLKPNILRRAETAPICRIIGILPADHGETQYRVRLGNETFERRILASDIETPETRIPQPSGMAPSSAGRNEPWLKPVSIRTKK
ncbi:cold-shock protein [Shinella sp. WSJ-2]|uniref:cold-shock protein n=1 Tax=Shinella sp. WSJ-2 TaxID=2303749 RepID=UPI000E3E33F1|nr:cold-shock protein [Shinella sp. WSJ-2]RFZ83637.1 cold-shock protein [Shinella sp. WSJ-2]